MRMAECRTYCLRYSLLLARAFGSFETAPIDFQGESDDRDAIVPALDMAAGWIPLAFGLS